MRRSKTWLRLAVVGLLSLVCAGAMPASAADSPSASLDRALQEQAPEILKQLREKGYKNVGVLKFRIKKGTDPVSDKVGTLNMFLADRLEVALILVNSNDPAKQIGIAKKASAVAAKIPGASHVTAEGRAKLFTSEYPLAWGDSSVKPDAFLTGIAQVSADLKHITVGILVFDASGGALKKVVPPFDAVTTPSMLGEVGESFTLRGAFDSAKPEIVQAKVIEVAAKVKTSDASHPLADPATPVMLEIHYDGKLAPLEFRNGKAFVAEPQEGQKVMLILRRTELAKGRLAVVVKVNGENTLNRQRLRDIDCRKWILDPGATPMKLEGYQLEADTAEEFRVLSDADSSAAEFSYGADVGMISLTVFREVGGEALPEVAPSKTPNVPQSETPKIAKKPDPSPTPPADLPDEAAEDLLALSRGIHPPSTPKNLAALKHQLREGGRTSDTRGLIAQGQVTASTVKKVQFTADPTPILSAAINYYSPKGAGKPAAN